MKKIGTLIITISVLAFLTGCAAVAVSPTSYDSVVVGKNDPDTDIKAIQNAVDQGGTILLKGTFDFGNKGSVKIKNDVSILGKIGTLGALKTVIKGGFWTFHSPLPSKVDPKEDPGPKIVVRNIHFDGALWTPLHFCYTSGAEISGNKITNVIPREIKYKWPGGESFWWQAGALLGTRFTSKKKAVVPGAVTGHLIFQNNIVDLENDKPQITLGQGVWFNLTWGANIEIRGNVVTNVTRNSLESLDNYLDEEGSGSILITDNKIVTPTVGIPLPSSSTPNGIVVGWFFDKSGGVDPSRNSKIIIKRNYIEARGDTSIGIYMLADRGVVTNNEIVLDSGSKAKALSQLGSDGLFVKNKFGGSGMCAIFAGPHPKFKVFKGRRNTFVLNDISSFKATSANALFMGDNNVLFGKNGKVIAKGKGNQIIEDVE